jgi:hypothetical protein
MAPAISWQGHNKIIVQQKAVILKNSGELKMLKFGSFICSE